MDSKRRLIVAGVLLAGPALARAQAVGSDANTLVTRELTVGGRVQRPLDLSLDSLRSFPVQEFGEIPIRDRSGVTVRTLKDYSGVQLTDILDQAGFIAAEHNDLKKTIVVATASDAYKAVFSWNELYNTTVGSGVYVLTAKNGAPLGDEEGKITLISTKDIHTGPRHVRWLKDVQVQRIA
jgi:hypothetical protein